MPRSPAAGIVVSVTGVDVNASAGGELVTRTLFGDAAPCIVADPRAAEALVEVSPGVRLFGLARAGEVGAKGMPGPLQLAVIGHEYRDTVVFARPPAAVQKVIIPPLAALGRLMGRRPMYHAYLEPAVMEEPDPGALAELTEDGSLRPLSGIG